MAQIRGKKEGSIHQRKNGSWRAQVVLEGRRLSFSAKSRRECQDWLKKTIGQIDNGLQLASTTVTLGDYLRNWLAITKTSKSPSTWSHYEQLIRTYVQPHLGKFRLHDLRPDQIQLYYNRLLDAGVSENVIHKIHTMLHSALEQAVKTGLADRNAVHAAIPPKPHPREMLFLDEAQVSQMLVAARGSRMEAILHLAVATGMRQMELLGLRWTDLDWVKQTLRIDRQLLRSSRGEVKYSLPKTKQGRRTIALGDQTIAVLHRWYDLQNEQRKSAGENWKEYGLIFTSKVGTPIYFRNLLRDFQLLLRNNGLPVIRFHDLRHTAASLMLNHGIPLIIVSRRLGHAKPSITLDVYGHLIPSMQAEAAQKIDELITPVEIIAELDRTVGANVKENCIITAPNCTTTAPELHKVEPK